MNERIKELRKTLGMTLEKFGERLGVKKAAVSKWENGDNVSDSMFKSICREFNVNETWLRDGTGNMFVELTDRERLMKYTALLLTDTESATAKLIRSCINTYMELDEDRKKLADEIVKKIIDDMTKASD